MRLAIAIALSLSALVWSPTLLAAVTDPAQLTTEQRQEVGNLLETARMAASRGEHDQALVALSKAYEILELPAILFKMAEHNRTLGNNEAALKQYKQYLLRDPNTNRREDVMGYITVLERRLASASGLLSITTTPAGARVKIQGEQDVMEGATPLRLKLPAGKYTLDVSMPDHERVRESITLKTDQETTLRYALVSTKVVVAPHKPSKAPLVLGGVGVAAAIGAGVTQYMRVQVNKELDELDAQRTGAERPAGYDDKVEQHNRLQITSLALGGVAIVALGSAAIVWALDGPASSPSEATSTRDTPAVRVHTPGVWWTPDGAGVGVGLSF